jgi:hypothetical protein
MPEYLSYEYPQYSLSEHQDYMLAEYDRHLEPNRYKPNTTSVVRNTSVFNDREFNNHLDFFCTMNSISVQDIKRHIQYLENQLTYHPIITPRPLPSPRRVHLQSRIVELEARLTNLPEDKPKNVSSASINICDICIENPKRIAFRCGHVTCEDCAPKLTACPTCRKPITDRIKLFM